MISFAVIQEAHEAGLSIVPPYQDGSKRPRCFWKNADGKDTWTPAQTDRPPLTLLKRWYDPVNGLTGIGVVCGKVSGGLEVLDFDTRAGWKEVR